MVSTLFKLNLVLCLFLIEKQLNATNLSTDKFEVEKSISIIEGEADLELSISSDLAAVTVGQLFTFVLEVANNSLDCEANNVEVDFALPSEFVIDTILQQAGDFENDVWTIPSIPADESALMVLRLYSTEAGEIPNIAEIMAQDQEDPDSSPGNGATEEDDYSSINILVIPSASSSADLDVSIIEANLFGPTNDSILFEMELTNQGPEDAHNVEVQINFPEELLIATQHVDIGTLTNTNVWEIDTFIANQTYGMFYVFSHTLNNTNIEFSAEVIASDTDDIDSTPNNNLLVEDDQQAFSLQIGAAPATATIGDFIWHDENGNGLQDAGEPGIEGVGVRLIDENQNVVSETVSDVDGNFQFTNVDFGSYRLGFTITDVDMMFTQPEQQNSTSLDSNADPVTGLTDLFEVTENNSINLDIDAGYYFPVLIQGFIFDDLNTNGIFDAGESGIEGVSLNVSSDSTPQQMLTSGENGFYEIGNIPPGNYSLSLDGVPLEIPITTETLISFGAESEEQFTNINFGLILPENNPPCIDTIYQCTAPLTQFTICIPTCDPDGNSTFIRDFVSIFDCELTQISDTCFTHLPIPGLTSDTVLVEVCDVVAFDTLCVQWLVAIEVSEECQGGNLIGDLVWNDLNQDGVQDENESGIEGVEVTAIRGDGFEYSTTTDSDGRYELTNLPDESYTVTIQYNGDFTYTTASSFEVPLIGGTANTDIDFGLLLSSSSAPVACEESLQVSLAPTGSIEVCIPVCEGAEVAVLSEIESTSGINLNLSADTCFIYTAVDETYNDTITIRLCNEENLELCTDVTVFVTVAEGIGPIVEGESVCVINSQQTTINALANDSHSNGLPIFITGASQPLSGTVTVDEVNGLLIYNPNESFGAFDSFNYVVCDEQDNCETAQVEIFACPEDTCLANAGSLVAPANLTYSNNQSTEAFSAINQNLNFGYDYFYILTTDLDEADLIGYNIVAISEDGIFNIPNLGLPIGDYQVHGLSFQGSLADLQGLGLTTGEGLLNLISDGNICGDLIVPGQNISIINSDDECLADGGTVIGDEIIPIAIDANTSSPGVVGSLFNPSYDFLFILTEASEPKTILDVNITGTFNLGAFNLNDGDLLEIWGISVLEDNADIVSNFSDLEDLLIAFGTEDLCGDLTESPATYQIEVINTGECLADAGTLNTNGTTNIEQGEDFTPPTVSEQNTGLGYWFVLVGNGDIIVVGDLIGIDTEGLDTETNYEVYGLSFDGLPIEIMSPYPTLAELQTAIDNESICADLTENAALYTITEIPPTPNTECNYQEVCVPPFSETSNPNVLCPEFCNLESGSYVIDEDDVNSLFNCSVHVIGDCVEYLPLPAFYNTRDTVTVIGCDTINGICDTALFVMIVGCLPPVAVDDTYELGPGTEFELDVLANDSVECDYPLGIHSVLAIDPTIGVVNVNPDSTALLFQPADGFTGLVTFDYIATNNCGEVYPMAENLLPAGTLDATDQATVTINFDGTIVIEVIAVTDSVTTGFNTPVNIDVLSNDSGEGIEISSFTQASNGTVTNENGLLVYQPNDGFAGEDTFTYEICDPEGACDETTVVITVLEEGNQTPTTQPDFVTVEINTTIVIDVLANDSDLNGDSLTITELIGPDTGTAVINPDGTITYTPDETAGPGDYTFSYVVCDDGNPILCDTQSVLITVVLPDVNENPIAVADTVTAFQGDTLKIEVLLNDSDPDGDSLIVSISTPPFVGSVEITEVENNGVITQVVCYVPPAEFIGIDFFTYEICDNGDPELCATAQVQVNYVEIPVPSVLNLQPDIAYVPANDFIVIDVLNNDTGDSLFVSSEGTTNPMNGTGIINGNNEFVYTPNAGFTGTDYFFYTACDNQGNCETTLVAVIVFEETGNIKPSLGNDQFEVDLDETSILNVLGNDSDPNGDDFTVTEILNGDFGTFLINPDGTISFTPSDTLQAGEYIFDYIACDVADSILCDTASVLLAVGVEASNLAPIANNDTIPTDAMTSIFANVTDNDSDPNGNDLVVKLGSNPSNGELTLEDDGLFMYTPENTFSGIDYFMYILCDNQNPALADTAWVTLVVGEVQLGNLDAEPDMYQTPINTAISFSVLDNDSGDGALDVKEIFGMEFTGIFYTSGNGNLFFDEENNLFDYVPESGFVGTDYFCYTMTDETTACDSTCVSITVFDSPQNLPPLASNDVYEIPMDLSAILPVTSNDSDPENQAIEITQILNGPTFGQISIVGDGTLEYTPLSGFQGEDTFDYILCETADSTLCDTATVLIAIGQEASNNPPSAIDDIIAANLGEPATLDLLANDSDIDGDFILISSNTNPSAGILEIDSLGVGTFTPPDSSATDYVFLYSICDNGTPPLCDTAIVQILYGIMDTLPTDTTDTMIVDLPLIDAQPDVYQTAVNNPILIPVLNNDIGEGITITEFDTPLNGTLVESGNGFLYTPNQDFTGMEYFFYTICDTLNQCDSTLVSIDIFASANLAPNADNDCYEIEGGCESFDVLLNDADPENDTLMLISVGFPDMGGTAFIDTDNGTIEYCAPAGFTGVEVFTYTACDGFLPGGLCIEGTVVVKVGGAEVPNHPPVAKDSCIVVTNKQSTTLFLSDLVTDSDIGDTLTYSLASTPISGQVLPNNFQTGEVVYSPPNDTFIGEDYFTYVVCDDGLPSLCDTAYIKLSVMDSIPVIMVDTVIANNDSLQIDEGMSEDIFVTENDFPQDQGTVTIISQPGFGDLVDLGGNLFNYTPFPEFNGQDFFTYSLCVGELCDTAIVVITVGCDVGPFDDPESFPIKKGFSPNFDGINDYFNIPGLESCYGDLNPTLMVYNRWGNLVFERAGYMGSDNATSWDGRWNVSGGGGTDKDVPDGTYYWVLTLEDGQSRAGYVEILR